MICRKEQEADQLLTNQKPGLAADTVVIKLVYLLNQNVIEHLQQRFVK